MIKKLLIISFIILLIAYGVIIEKDVILQEGNPVTMMISITELHVTGEAIIRIPSEPAKYIMRNKDGFNQCSKKSPTSKQPCSR
jgi:hypothetical protein